MTTLTGIEANKELVRTYTQTIFNEHHTDRFSEFLARGVSVLHKSGVQSCAGRALTLSR